MAKKEPLPDAGSQKQQPLEQAKEKAEQSGPYGKQAHETAEEANMKRQQKQMHKQDTA